MSVLEILTEEFVAELPDDPRAAFGMVLRRAELYLADALRGVDDSERSSWHGYETAQHTAMNTIIAVARRYEIEPFASMAVPLRRNFSSEQFIEFKVELDHYAAQLILDNSIRHKREAIAIESKVKGRLRQHVSGIKTLIDQSELSEPQRSILLKKIADFETALERPRVNVLTLIASIAGILTVTATFAQLGDSPTMQKLISTILATIGEAKAIDDATREFPPGEPPRALLPPRPLAIRDETQGNPRAKQPLNLDDETPF